MNIRNRPVCEECKARENSPLKYCPLDELKRVDLQKTTTLYKKGQIILYEGSYPRGIYCISSGKIKIYKTGKAGKNQILRFARAGDWLGYRAILADETYAASAAAIEDSMICYIRKEDFLQLLQNNSYVSSCVMKMLAQELRFAEKRELSLSQKPVRERLAETFLLLKEIYGVKSEKDLTLKVQLSREELSDITGAATETLIRLLADFKEEKLIFVKGQSIKILNLQKLLEVAKIYD